ncbi:putative EamA domain-containing protein [Rosa chinensis]|uniref:WAT1-related protein n=1 Tax=Rosa chinensis TaxID=74649 RepID=A0A2P6S578_ROSCH|nr:putative EamA domain-containing protein [Rosa chinensis]
MGNLSPAFIFILAVVFRWPFTYCWVPSILSLVYPSASSGFLYNLCGTIILAPVCFLAERNLSAWRPQPVIPLPAIIYSGVFGSSVSILVHIWGLHLKGPVYISSFKPLSIAIAAAFGVIFLGDGLSLGSVVGAATLSIGFYAVIWGKGKRRRN